MDELEKNESLPEENPVDAEENKLDESEQLFDEADFNEAENNTVNESDEALQKELDEIRDMFQAELDKAANDEINDEVLIQELDDIQEDEETEPDEEIDEAALCECCGEKRRDTSFGEDYPYCADCRALMQKNPLNWFGIIAVVLTIGVAMLSFFLIKDNVDDFTTLIDAENAYSENKLVAAVSTYQQYLSSKSNSDDISKKAVKHMIDCMASLGYYGDADSIMSSYMTEAELNRPSNKKYKEIKSSYELLMKTQEVINETLGNDLRDTKKYDANLKKLDEVIAKNKETNEYDEAFLEYGKYLVMAVNQKDDDTQLTQLKKIQQVDGGRHPWIYITSMMEIASKTGDMELVQSCFDEAMKVNREETTMYVLYANVFRFTDKPDADKILEIAKEAEENFTASSFTSPMYYRSYAIGYLLKNDGEKAMEAMSNYMQNCQTDLNDFNLYALCASVVKDDDAYKYAKETVEGAGYKLSGEIAKYRSGKMTLQQVLTTKGVEI